ncbi:hypothetical protein Q4566_01965 [Tamlana sp. 2_MG-2023]|uniref:hypothetical protein n=1 Tax=unclassified Tamlana TaxID=2614803 RepID=UPI0026E2CEBA|nr:MULTISPECIES: hypothetical protein [unclassified Tamlana]MDO6758951.1 hypothetical protein [Tamlana sp. 2_MG-2023]MDO6789650.1 hypothetical protein [Tamlana sp. 1_MG-2023]
MIELTSKIQAELQVIITKAIADGKLNKETTRMVIIRFSESFNHLLVYAHDSWDLDYDYSDIIEDSEKELEARLGHISIQEWIDIADEAFDNQDKLDTDYTNQALTLAERYEDFWPIIHFNHHEDGLYKSFLIVLRERLLEQINDAVAEVACQNSDTFTHLVGFVMNEMIFDDSDNSNHICAFTFPQAKAPFHKTHLLLPKIKITYPFAKVVDDGFILLYPKGSVLNKNNEEESNAYYLKLADMDLVVPNKRQKNKFVFRLKTETENWELSNNYSEGEWIKPALELYADLNKMAGVQPKLAPSDEVPDPMQDKQEFATWLKHFVDGKMNMHYKQINQILTFKEASIQLIADMCSSSKKHYETILEKWAEAELEKGNYQKCIDILKNHPEIGEYENAKLVESYYHLGDQSMVACFNAIKFYKPKNEVSVYHWVNEVKLRQAGDSSLRSEEEMLAEIDAFIQKYTSYAMESSGYLALCRLYTLQGKKSEAIKALANVDFSTARYLRFARTEFKDESDLINVIEEYETRQLSKQKTEATFEAITVSAPRDEDKYECDLQPQQQLKQYVEKEEDFDDMSCNWIMPLNEHRFVTFNEKEGVFLVERKADGELVKTATVTEELPHNPSPPSYANGELYIPFRKKGIAKYVLQGDEFVFAEILQSPQIFDISALCVSGDYLYAVNNDFLEVYSIKNGEFKLISEPLYIGLEFGMHIYGNLLIIDNYALALIDISDATKPAYLSRISDTTKGENGYVAVIDNYLVCSSVFDISDLSAPKHLLYLGDEVTPVIDFTGSIPKSVFASASYPMLKQLVVENGKVQIKKWISCTDEDGEDETYITSNLAVFCFKDRMLTWTDFRNTHFELVDAPPLELPEKINFQSYASFAINYMLEDIHKSQPDFLIGKFVLDAFDSSISIQIHPCSSLVTISDGYTQGRTIPICKLRFSYYNYCKEILGKPFDEDKMRFVLDLDVLKEQILNSALFKKMQSKHIYLNIGKSREIITNLEKPWQPFIASFNNDVANPVIENKELNASSLAHLLIDNFEHDHKFDSSIDYEFVTQPKIS